MEGGTRESTQQNSTERERSGPEQRADELSVIVAIVDALSGVGGSATTDVPLYEYVDTDALGSLVRNSPTTSELQVRFRVEDQTVVVTGDGTVLVR